LCFDSKKLFYILERSKACIISAASVYSYLMPKSNKTDRNGPPKNMTHKSF